MVSQDSHVYKYSGEHVYFGTFVDSKTGMRRKVMVDRFGVTTNIQEASARDRAAYNDRYGLLTRELFETLYLAPDPLEVSIGYRVSSIPGIDGKTRPTAGPSVVTMKALWTARAAAWAGPRAAVLQMVKAENGSVLKEPQGLPVVVALLSHATLRRMAGASKSQFSPVLRVAYRHSPDAKKAASTAFFRGSDNLEVLETFHAGSNPITGQDVRVGIFENTNNCWAWETHPSASTWSGYTPRTQFAAQRTDPSGCYQRPDGASCSCEGGNAQAGVCRGQICRATHLARVASEVGLTSGADSKLAYRAHLYDAQASAPSVAFEWFASQGVPIVNVSRDTMSGTHALSWAARNQRVVIARAAGNSWYTPVDCTANSICVGAYEFTYSGSTADYWKNDPTNSFGAYTDHRDSYGQPILSYKNGMNGNQSLFDMEKPDLMAWHFAPGINVASAALTPSPGGSSFAAPRIAGLAALLYEYSEDVRGEPELMRALLMASAVSHNVEGAPLSTNTDGIDEFDGAGVPIAQNAKRILDRGWFTDGTLYPESFDDNDQKTVISAIEVPAGAGIRAILSWMYCAPDAVGTQNEFLSTDFDLQLMSGGTYLAWSDSYFNNVEMIEWTNTSGSARVVNLKVRLWQHVFSSCAGQQRERFAVAYAIHQGHLIND